MNVLDNITEKSFLRTRSILTSLRLSISADIDVFIINLTEARKNDPENNDKIIEGSFKFKIEKLDKYYGNHKKLKP